MLLALAACGEPASQPETAVTTSARTTTPSVATPSPRPRATAATPAAVPKGQQFKLDDVAEFEDGLMIDIAGTVADEAAKTDRGAEATNGEIVIASIRIKNNTKKPYDAQDVLIGAKYSTDKDAQIIIDRTDQLQSGFQGKIKPKDQKTATVGFAVPWKELKKVTFVVDPNDDVHEAISFTGQVHRD
jgi:hypothetical protein